MLMTRLWVCSNSTSMDERVRLSKLKTVLMDGNIEFSYVGWKRSIILKQDISYDLHHPFKYISPPSYLLPILYLLWAFSLFLFLLRNVKKDDTLYAMGFESAISVYMISKIKGCSYIFDNPDNFSTSFKLKGTLKKVIDWAESVFARNSVFHVLPSPSRVILPTPRDHYILNTPSKIALTKAHGIIKEPNLDDFVLSVSLERKFKIYLNGRLVDDRGGDYLPNVFSKLDPKLFSIIIVGDIKSKKFTDFVHSTSLKVYHINRVPNEIALAIYHFCDVTIALYSPTREINLLAESNKWYDSVAMGIPFISNSEIKSMINFKTEPLSNVVSYGNVEELLTKILDLSKVKVLKSIKIMPDWNEEMLICINHLQRI